ncbi:hypothetical protein ACHAPT_007097 [Fusarium lateritium]
MVGKASPQQSWPVSNKSYIEFFESLKNNHPTRQPGQKAAYSNSGLIILGFVLETVTSQKFKDIIHKKLSKPLGLSSATGFDLQDLSRAALPPEGGFELISIPLGNYNPTAALYSTPDDLAKFVRSILRHDILSAPQTDLWLKPTSFLFPSQGTVGMTWEIYRTSDLTPCPRPVDIYTKASDSVLYAAYIIIILEYSVGIAINVAGPDSHATGRDLLDLIFQDVVRYCEVPAREQARNKHTEKYTTNNDSLFRMVNQGPGIEISEWTSQGKSVLEAWASISGGKDPKVDARIYPVGEYERGVPSAAQTPPPNRNGHSSFTNSPQNIPLQKMCCFDIAPMKMVCGHRGPDSLLRLRPCEKGLEKPCGDYQFNYFGMSRKRDPCVECIVNRVWTLVNGRWRNRPLWI